MNKQASSSLSTQPLVTPGSVHGWNDPPFISSIMPQHSSTQPMPDNLPLKDSVPDSTLDIQPLVEQRSVNRQSYSQPGYCIVYSTIMAMFEIEN